MKQKKSKKTIQNMKNDQKRMLNYQKTNKKEKQEYFTRT